MNTKISIAMSVLIAVTAGLSGCDTYQEPLPPRDALYFPIGVEMHPDGRYLYVVNSNYDLRYRDDQGGTISVIDTETGQIREGGTPFLPSFGGHLELNEDATKLYAPTRHQNAITVLTVHENGSAVYCDVDGERQADTRPCTVRRIPDTRQGASVPSDPFGVAVGRTRRGPTDEEIDLDLVHLSHVAGREVTSIAFPDGEVAGASMRSASLMDRGSNQVAIRPGTEDVYAAGRNTSRVEAYQPFISDQGEVEAIVRRDSIAVTRRGENMDARGMAFSEDGQWLYVATRRPNALHIIGMEPAGGGSPEVITSIALEHRPSEVQFHRGADDVERVYVPSFRRGIIEVIEPDREAVVDTIDVGRSPYSMTVDPRPYHCTRPNRRCQGYVTLFDVAPDGEQRCDDDARECGKVAVVDLDPVSENFHTVIDTIE